MSLSTEIDLWLISILFLCAVLVVLLQKTPSPKLDFYEAINSGRRHTSPWMPSVLIRQAGFSPKHFSALYWASKIFTLVASAAVIMEIQLKVSEAQFILICVGSFFLTDIWLQAKRKQRKKRIENASSYLMSLLIIYLEMGNGLSRAIRQAATYGLDKDNPLAEEMMLIVAEIDAGKATDACFKDLAQRTGVSSLTRMAAILQLNAKLGSEATDIMASQYEICKADMEQTNLKQTSLKSLEAMLPALLTCFPMFFALVIYPAGYQIMQLLSLLGDLL
jgi:tight adherence protein C